MSEKSTNDDRPIGVFDSGFGGLTIVRQLIKKMPAEKIIYFGDSINAPYGNRSKKEIVELSLAAADYLAKKKIKALILACNTACVYAFKALSNALNIPIFEIVSPSYQLALNLTKNNKLGVTATRATIKSGVYRKKILQARPYAEVHSFSCPKLVSLIEEGLSDPNQVERIVKEYFGFLKEKEIDVLLLACTHYPLLKDVIQKEIGNKIMVLDPSIHIVEEVYNFLRDKDLLADKCSKQGYEFITSGDVGKFKVIAERFLEKKIDKVEKK